MHYIVHDHVAVHWAVKAGGKVVAVAQSAVAADALAKAANMVAAQNAHYAAACAMQDNGRCEGCGQ